MRFEMASLLGLYGLRLRFPPLQLRPQRVQRRGNRAPLRLREPREVGVDDGVDHRARAVDVARVERHGEKSVLRPHGHRELFSKEREAVLDVDEQLRRRRASGFERALQRRSRLQQRGLRVRVAASLVESPGIAARGSWLTALDVQRRLRATHEAAMFGGEEPAGLGEQDAQE